MIFGEVRRVPVLQSLWGRLGGEWALARAGVSLLPLLPLLHLLSSHQRLPARPPHPSPDHLQHGGQQGDADSAELLLHQPTLDQAGVEAGSASGRTGQDQGDLIIIIIIILIIIYRGWSFCFMGSYQKRILKTENYGIISSTETILIQMTATFGSNWGKTLIIWMFYILSSTI